jgi:hypothetical protein
MIRGQACEYMIFPKVDNIFIWSFALVICFTTFSTHGLHTCHKHKFFFGPWPNIAAWEKINYRN